MNFNQNEEITKDSSGKLPFNNLFLNIGLVEGNNKLWMYLFGILFTIVSYSVIGSILIMPLYNRAINMGISQDEILSSQNVLFDYERLQLDKNFILLIEFSFFVAAFIALFFAVKLVHKKRFITLLTAFEKFRFKNFLFAFAIWAIIVIGVNLISYYIDGDNMTIQFEPVNFLKLLVICLLFLPIQTLTEEIFFRAYLLQGLSQVFKNGMVPLVLTSLLFAAAHLTNPEAGAFGTGIMFGYYVLFAVFLGVITLLSEGLELAYGIHLANNLFSALLVTSKNSVLKTDAVFYMKQENVLVEFVFALIGIISVFLIFKFKFNWKNFSLILK